MSRMLLAPETRRDPLLSTNPPHLFLFPEMPFIFDCHTEERDDVGWSVPG